MAVNIKGNGGGFEGEERKNGLGVAIEGQGKYMIHLVGLEKIGYKGKNSSTIRILPHG